MLPAPPLTEITHDSIYHALSQEVAITYERLLQESRSQGLPGEALHTRAREIILELLLQDFTTILAKSHNLPNPLAPPSAPPTIPLFSGDCNTRSHTVSWFLRQVENYVSANGPKAVGLTEDDKRINTAFAHLAKNSRQDRARMWMLSWVGARTGIDMAAGGAACRSFRELTWGEFETAFKEEFDPELEAGGYDGQRAALKRPNKLPELERATHSCGTCALQFDSGNALHRHLRQRKHFKRPAIPTAVPLSQVRPVSHPVSQLESSLVSPGRPLTSPSASVPLLVSQTITPPTSQGGSTQSSHTTVQDIQQQMMAILESFKQPSV
jgi:hypothetical protein